MGRNIGLAAALMTKMCRSEEKEGGVGGGCDASGLLSHMPAGYKQDNCILNHEVDIDRHTRTSKLIKQLSGVASEQVNEIVGVSNAIARKTHLENQK